MDVGYWMRTSRPRSRGSFLLVNMSRFASCMLKLKIILTGASGMVGEGVLYECLHHPDVKEILVIGRRSCGAVDPKLKEILIEDFYDLSSIENNLTGYNCCFFCLGTSSVGKKEAEFYTTQLIIDKLRSDV